MNYLLFVFLFIATVSFGQKYHEVDIIYRHGEKVQGYAKLPRTADKIIKFKPGLKGKKQKVKSKHIYHVVFFPRQGVKHTLEYNTKRVINLTKAGELKERLGKRPLWFYVAEQHEKLNFYKFSGKYHINRRGDVIFFVTDMADVFYFFKKPGQEEYVTFMKENSLAYNLIGAHVRSNLAAYFKDDEEFYQRIIDKEFKGYSLTEVYHEYIGNY